MGKLLMMWEIDRMLSKKHRKQNCIFSIQQTMKGAMTDWKEI